MHPKWLEHHQSGHLTKDQQCPVCMEEAGSKVAHRRKKGDRQPGIMDVDLAAFEASADGNMYCLAAAVTIELGQRSPSYCLSSFQCRRRTLSVHPAIKEALISVKTAIYIKSLVLELCESKQMAEVISTIRSSRTYAGTRTLFCPFLQRHQLSSNGIAERMVGILKSIVRQMLKQAHLEREWWSYACRICRSHDDERKF